LKNLFKQQWLLMNLVQLEQRFIIDIVVVICKLGNTTFPWTLSLVLGQHMNSGTIHLLGTIKNNIIKLSQNNKRRGNKKVMKQNQHKRAKFRELTFSLSQAIISPKDTWNFSKLTQFKQKQKIIWHNCPQGDLKL
jgi:hypothetical protein